MQFPAPPIRADRRAALILTLAAASLILTVLHDAPAKIAATVLQARAEAGAW